MVLGLHGALEIGAHLAKSVAAGPAHTRVRVTESRHDELEDSVELTLHELVAAFTNGRDSHERSVSVPPVGRSDHPWQPGESWGQHDLASEPVGKTIHALLTSDVI